MRIESSASADIEGNPVDGVVMHGTWSEDYNVTISEVTAADGTMTFTSSKVRKANATFTFTVDDLVEDRYAYDPGLNNETSHTISRKPHFSHRQAS